MGIRTLLGCVSYGANRPVARVATRPARLRPQRTGPGSAGPSEGGCADWCGRTDATAARLLVHDAAGREVHSETDTVEVADGGWIFINRRSFS